MANQFASGETYADGQTVNAARLNNTVNLATAQPGLITEQGLVTPVPADQLLIHQVSSGLLKRATIVSAISPAFFQGAQTPNVTGIVSGTCMAGLPGTITPTFSGRISIHASGTISNHLGESASVALSVGTGTKPVNGAPNTGTGVGGSSIAYVAGNTGDNYWPFGLSGIVTGLVIGTTYWLDCAMTNQFGGTSAPSLNYAAICAFEF